jgi:hypothetical protein
MSAEVLWAASVNRKQTPHFDTGSSKTYGINEHNNAFPNKR